MEFIFKTEDEIEAGILLNAVKYKDALDHISYNIKRKYLKYSELSDTETAIVQKVFDDISEYLVSEEIYGM